jgi:CheY-like chemotaxis protein
VVVTGVSADNARLEAAREAGADAVLLTDAFEPRQVLAMLRELLAQP